MFVVLRRELTSDRSISITQRVLQRNVDVKRRAPNSKWLTRLTSFVEIRAYHWARLNHDLSTGINKCSTSVSVTSAYVFGSFRKRPHTSEHDDKQLENEPVAKSRHRILWRKLDCKKVKCVFHQRAKCW